MIVMFFFFSETEDDVDDGTYIEQETQYHGDDNDAHDDLLDGYKSDNRDYRAMSDFKTKHHFSRMSHTLGGEMFVDRAEPIRFRVGQRLKNV